MASHATTSNAVRACQARRKRLIPYWDRFLPLAAVVLLVHHQVQRRQQAAWYAILAIAALGLADGFRESRFRFQWRIGELRVGQAFAAQFGLTCQLPRCLPGSTHVELGRLAWRRGRFLRLWHRESIRRFLLPG